MFILLTKLWYTPICFRFGFLRFSNHADAVRALSDINGYNLRGSVLKISPGIQSAKSCKGKKEEPKVVTKKNKNTTIANGFASKDAVVTELKPSSSRNSKSPLSSPREMKTVTCMLEESWETGSTLSPKMVAVENKKFFDQGNFVTCVNKEEEGFPVHVSNFPIGTKQVQWNFITKWSGKNFFKSEGKLIFLRGVRKKNMKFFNT